jgi:Putative transposase
MREPAVAGRARTRAPGSRRRTPTACTGSTQQHRSTGRAARPARAARRAARDGLGRLRQAPLAGPEQVLDYLGRYTHRVAISNERLVSASATTVCFRYKDYAHGERRKTMRLQAREFLRRFALHVLPRGFMRIRHYGLLANRTKGSYPLWNSVPARSSRRVHRAERRRRRESIAAAELQRVLRAGGVFQGRRIASAEQILQRNGPTRHDILPP